MKKLLIILLLVLSPIIIMAQETTDESIAGSIDIELKLGEGKKILIPEVYKYDSITWQSSDELIVSVNDDGYVNAIAPGEAKVQAKMDNGITLNYNIKVTTGVNKSFNKIKEFVIKNWYVFVGLTCLIIIYIFVKYT